MLSAKTVIASSRAVRYVGLRGIREFQDFMPKVLMIMFGDVGEGHHSSGRPNETRAGEPGATMKP